MRIGIVLSKPPGYSETFFMSKIKGLKENGHDVMLYVQSNEKAFDLCTVKSAYPVHVTYRITQFFWILVVFFKMLINFKRVSKFIKMERLENNSWLLVIKRMYGSAHILTENLDWLHFGFATMALGKENVAKSINSKMAVSLRGFDVAIYPIKNPNCYSLLWKRVDKVHTISNDLYALALKHGLSKEISFQRITPAIDVNLFKTTRIESTIKNNELKILTVGRLHWKKGFTYTLKALKLLKEQGLKFHYTVIGEGDEFEKLMYVRHKLGLDDSVTFLGKTAHDEVKNSMALHDLYIQYSISEGFCNAVLEAQAMGMLCVVSDAEGLAENVLDKRTGWVVPKRSPEKLAAAIVEVSQMAEEDKNRIKDAAINRIFNEFNLEKQQQEFLKFYNS